ncbi:type II toxin-antitoxin system RelE/ParE family toxin [Nonomuraea sp. NPDC050556]|uniref:type II toxin-antitoxin system RelE/ParE family toxin n=1 Tax=Nonomuraea sp. NPDC050556 TaxID=3364369 RepID=UPI003799C188
MSYEIRLTDDVDAWLDSLAHSDTPAYRLAVDTINRLEEQGPGLRRPLVGKIDGSSIVNLKELRPRSTGTSALRILFVFDPWRSAILLVAGDKVTEQPGNPDRWYDKAIPQAEHAYQTYLAERAEEEGQNR